MPKFNDANLLLTSANIPLLFLRVSISITPNPKLLAIFFNSVPAGIIFLNIIHLLR